MPGNAFNPEEVLRIAELARIELTADEQALYARQLSEILAFAQQVQGIDTHDVPPTSHPTGVTGLLRDDVVAGIRTATLAMLESGEYGLPVICTVAAADLDQPVALEVSPENGTPTIHVRPAAG